MVVTPFFCGLRPLVGRRLFELSQIRRKMQDEGPLPSGLGSKMSDWRTAVHYRNRAEVLRAIAEEIDHDDHRLTLRKIAADLDKVAVALERDARTASG